MCRHCIFVYLFLPFLPSSRLRDRKTEQEDAIRKRLERAQQELDYGSVPGNFDLVIVNDNVDKASKELNDFMADKVDELNKVKNLVQSKT